MMVGLEDLRVVRVVLDPTGELSEMLEDLEDNGALAGVMPEMLVSVLVSLGAERHEVSIGDDGEISVRPILLLDEGQTYLVMQVSS